MFADSWSSPWAWCGARCWAGSSSSPCSLWWGRAGCHSVAPSQSAPSWWTGGWLRSAECWQKQQDQSQFCFDILNSEIYCTLGGTCVFVCVCDYLRFFRKDAGSLASSVLTRPNSCMTLSSCLRSSWPFSRNMNSWPLLPAEGAAINNI